MNLASTLYAVSRLWGAGGKCPTGFVVINTIPGGVNPAYPAARIVVSGQPGIAAPPADVLVQTFANVSDPEDPTFRTTYAAELPYLRRAWWTVAGETVYGWLKDAPATRTATGLANVWMGEVSETPGEARTTDLLWGSTPTTLAEMNATVARYPAWSGTSVKYLLGDARSYASKLYRCVQGHTSQAGWHPDAVPALWAPWWPPGVIAPWVQPTGAQDAYAKGTRVTFNGHIYESLIDANVWSPTAYPAGWKLIS